MKKGNGLVEWAMRYNRIVMLFVVLLMILGIAGLYLMPKQEFPEFTIRQGVIVGVYPGATSHQVEEQLAKPLEEFLFTYKEIKRKKTYTMSRDGMVYAMVELNDKVNNKDEVWSKIKHGLTTFKQQLPAGVLALIANDDFGDTSALLITLESDIASYRELENYLTDLEGRLRRIPSVSNLRRYGIQSEQITIYPDRDKLAVYGIDYKTLAMNLFTQGFTTATGTIDTSEQELPLYISAPFTSEKEIEEQLLYSDPGGHFIRIKDVASVVREYDKPDNYILNNGRKAILLSLEMLEGHNIVLYGKEVDKVLNEFTAGLPEGIYVERIADQPKVVNESVMSFLRDLVISIIVVILVMMLLFPFRSAIVAATTVPVSIFISIGIMYLVGIPLNTVTLAALIVVLGMVVDNSIVVVDGYLEYLNQGRSRWYAAILSAKNYAGSILLATLCICVIFYPILFTFTGMYHDFLIHFPFTLTITLLISFLLAIIYIPYMEYLIIKRKKTAVAKKKKFDLFSFIQESYNKVLKCTFRFPKTTIATGLGLLPLSVLLFTTLDQRMMPMVDRDQFAVEIYLPQGTPTEVTAAIADSVYRELSQDERVRSITSFIGMASPRFQASYAPQLAGKNYAQFIVNTLSIEATSAILDDYTDRYANHFPDAYVKFKQLDNQEVATPIEVRFSGHDIDELKQYAGLLVDSMRTIDGLVWIHTNYEEMQPGVAIELKPTEASRLGINKAMAQTELATAYTGITAGTLWEGDYALPVVIKNEKNNAETIQQVGDQYIATGIPGVSVPLRQVADIHPVWNEGQIVRRNGVWTMSVMADVQRGQNEMRLFEKVEAVMEKAVIPQLPASVSWEYGGMVESDNEILEPIITGMTAAVVLVFFFLLFSFKKINISLVCMLSILLSLPGTAFGLWITNTQFGLTCILGIISLIGIIVRNGIIMFDHAEELRLKKHLSAKEAAYNAGERRMIPIFLTSATTAMGVIPMIISNSSLWAPMGIVIFFGTVVAMVLVVTILPVVYWKIFAHVKVKKIHHDQ